MKPILYFFLFLIFSFSLKAQNDDQKQKNDLDNKYTPNSSSMFNNLVKKDYDANSYTEVEIKNQIKFCPTYLARLRAVLFYERAIVKGLTLTGGIGKSLGQDIFQNLFFTLGGGNVQESSVLTPDWLVNANNRTAWKGNPLLFGGAKYYFTNNAFEEGFIEFNYRRESQYFLLKQSISDNSGSASVRVDGENDVKFIMNGFNFGFGYTGVSGDKNSVTHEFFINFGVKFFKYTMYNQITQKNPVTNANELIFQKVSDTYVSARILPSFNIGYSFGFGWK